ncbi:uncharacterized protein [Anas acuta]|uniref:uncharacterized protein isoform X1 n=2 Tax=Anas acuta TaxID=28680 RepID=UPI0035C918B2
MWACKCECANVSVCVHTSECAHVSVQRCAHKGGVHTWLCPRACCSWCPPPGGAVRVPCQGTLVWHIPPPPCHQEPPPPPCPSPGVTCCHPLGHSAFWVKKQWKWERCWAGQNGGDLGCAAHPKQWHRPPGSPVPKVLPWEGGGSGCHPSCPPPPPRCPQCPRRRLAAGVGILRCQPPGGPRHPEPSQPLCPRTMAAPRARGGPQHPPHTPPPRPPHPSARTDGHRRRDRGTEGRPWGTPLVGAEGGGRCRSGGGLLCAASGLALLVTATATDFWLQHRAPGGTAAIGLWHLCLGGHCRPPPGPPAFWDATRVLMLLAVLAAATGFALGLSAAAAGAARRARARAAGVTLLLAGVLALLGLAVCTAGARSLLGPAPGAWRLSWSYLLAWVAVVLTGSAGLFHLCAAAKDPSPESSESGGP